MMGCMAPVGISPSRDAGLRMPSIEVIAPVGMDPVGMDGEAINREPRTDSPWPLPPAGRISSRF
jgi:hypothetical protein